MAGLGGGAEAAAAAVAGYGTREGFMTAKGGAGATCTPLSGEGTLTGRFQDLILKAQTPSGAAELSSASGLAREA